MQVQSALVWARFISLLLLHITVLQSLYMLWLLPLTSRGITWLHVAALCLTAQPVAVFAILHNGLVVHGVVAVRIIIEHGVIVRGRVCDNAHEDGDQRHIIDKGKKEGRVDCEEGDGAHGGYDSGGRCLHAFLAEFYRAGVADTGHPQRLVGNPRKIRT